MDANNPDFVTNRVLSVEPVATGRGSDFVTNRVLSVEPGAPQRVLYRLLSLSRV
jgi:hypothetical protein